MRNSCFFFFLTTILLFTLSCNSGSNSHGGSTGASTPVLKSITISPNSGSQGGTHTIDYIVTFSDPGGDLGGGRAYYNFEEIQQDSLPLPDSLTLVNEGSSSGQIPLTLKWNQELGTYNVSFWLVDKAGNESNTLNATFTVLCNYYTYTIRCTSEGFQRKQCGIGSTTTSIVLLTQYSDAPCIRNQSWGWNSPFYFWVDQGCDADFSVCHGH